MLVGLVAGGVAAPLVLFYLLTYTFTTAGAFGPSDSLCEAVEAADYVASAAAGRGAGLFLLARRHSAAGRV